MQQLTLFGKTMSRSPRRPGAKTNVRHGPTSEMRWDLWTQETEPEREMALFFLDIRNFTALIEKRQALDVIHIVKKLFSTFQKIIHGHHGKIIDTSGDGFYAAFGFDGDVEKAVNASCNAGLAILKTLDYLNARSFEKNLLQRIEVGIGIHVGKVATDKLHLGSKDHLVVRGYPVNVASRLQATTRALHNNFIVSSAVYNHLKYSFRKSRPMKINLKGVSDPFELHLLGKPYQRPDLTSVLSRLE